MEYILSYFKEYDCEFKDKIFYIRKPISVKRFLEVKRLLKYYRGKIEDIRVDTFNGLRSNYERRF